MRTVVALPSTASFAQQAALAFHERRALVNFSTAFVYDEAGPIGRALSRLPASIRQRVEPQLKRRMIDAVPRSLVAARPFWEIVRTLAYQAGATAPMVDRIWDQLSRDFTRALGRQVKRGGIDAVYAYEYTALEAFNAAKACGVARILDFPSLNSRQFEKLQKAEKLRYPELAGPYEAYFDAKFQERQARRDTEMRLADVIITNSSVTCRSHIEGGAAPEKTFAVPYGAPPPIDTLRERSLSGPLRVVWAGTFSVRKGAHHFIEAWRQLGAGTDARANIYGAITVPERLWKPVLPGLHFHGSVVRSTLFQAFDEADVLMFPTLSDGFGMVVTEAFARGLPVITTDQAGASDLVRHKENGLLIPAGDSSAISSALTWCLENRVGLAAMRAPALETARGWQWPDYRRALIEAVSTGLERAGYPPQLGFQVSA